MAAERLRETFARPLRQMGRRRSARRRGAQHIGVVRVRRTVYRQGIGRIKRDVGSEKQNSLCSIYPV